eukprot:10157444-Alexandrium_andersonii.AAC.1
MPRRPTWADLCDGVTLGDVLRAATAATTDSALKGYCSWNIRWITQPHAAKVEEKTAAVASDLAAGRV